jgi:nicotinamidase/pyrazinamidase
VVGNNLDFATFALDEFGVSIDLAPSTVHERAAAELSAAMVETTQRKMLAKYLTKRRALILVDIQRDFCSGGSLAVPDGDAIIELVNSLRTRWNWDLVVLTQDWHPSDHVSFASNNEGSTVFSTIDLEGIGPQVMWPDHCVQGSKGAEFHPALETDVGCVLSCGDDVGSGPSREVDSHDIVVRKGTVREVDSYSGFGDASVDHEKEKTPLGALLRSREIDMVVVVGLAQDFCVSFTAQDASREGFDVVMPVDATRGITPEGVSREMRLCEERGVLLSRVEELPTREMESSLREEMGLAPWRPAWDR